MKILSYILLLQIYFGVNTTFAQNVYFKNYSIEQGLVQSQVTNITEDENGFLWFVTRGGISRYDGNSFVNFQEKNGLIDNRCLSFLLDGQNAWIGTTTGLTVTDLNNIRNTGIINELIGYKIYAIAKDEDNTIWCGSDAGLHKIQSDSTKHYTIKHYTTTNKYNFGAVRNIFVEQDKLWLGCDHGVHIYHKGTFAEYKANFKIASTQVNYIIKDNHFNYWFATNRGVFKDDGKYLINFTEHNGLAHNNVNSILQDENGAIWFATDNGITKYSNNTFRSYKENEGLTVNRTLCIEEDREGNLWFGSNGGGVHKLEKSIFTNISDKNGLPNNLVWTISEHPKNTIWIGTENGLWQSENNITRIFTTLNGLPDNKISYLHRYNEVLWIGTDGSGLSKYENNNFRNYDASDGLSGENIFAMDHDNDGNLWIGSQQGLSKFDGKSFKNFSLKDGLNDLRVNSLLFDKKGRLWIGTEKGLNYMQDGLIKDFNDEHKIGNSSVMTILEDDDGDIWFSSYGLGVVCYVKNSDDQIRVVSHKDGIDQTEIYLMNFDKEGNLWTGNANGLTRIKGMKFKKTGFIALSHYGRTEGFRGIECNRNATFLDSKNNLWFGTVAGVNKYNPQFDKPNSHEPVVHITNVRIFFENIDWNELIPCIEMKNGLPQNPSLAYNKNHITFDFIGISMTAPEKVSYICKLEGFDTEWTPVFKEHSITYSNLPPGEYNFLVKSSNNNINWNNEAKSFSFIIVPPFWQTTYFLLLSIAVTLLSIYVFISLRTRNLKAQRVELERLVNKRTKEVIEKATLLEESNEKLVRLNANLQESEINLKKLNDSKDRFFSIIAHDLKSPFTSLLGFTRMLAENVKDFTKEEIEDSIESINKSANKVYTLLENLLEWSRIQIGGIEFQPIATEIYKQVEDVVVLLEQMASQKNISLINNVNKDFKAFIDRNMINTVLRNIISNAIKFTYPDGKIIISAENDNKYVKLFIQDEGVGMNESDINKLFKIDVHHTTHGTNNEKGTGVGLILCKELVEKNGGEIYVESTEGKGSKFIFTMPKVREKIEIEL